MYVGVKTPRCEVIWGTREGETPSPPPPVFPACHATSLRQPVVVACTRRPERKDQGRATHQQTVLILLLPSFGPGGVNCFLGHQTLEAQARRNASTLQPR